MSYIDKIFDMKIKNYPNVPEFHQAVKKELNSLRSVAEAMTAQKIMRV